MISGIFVIYDCVACKLDCIELTRTHVLVEGNVENDSRSANIALGAKIGVRIKTHKIELFLFYFTFM